MQHNLVDLVMPRTKQNISRSNIVTSFDSNIILLWIQFVNHKYWKSTKHSVLCELHFEEKYIVRGGKANLKCLMNPIPIKTFQGAAKNAVIFTTNQ